VGAHCRQSFSLLLLWALAAVSHFHCCCCGCALQAVITLADLPAATRSIVISVANFAGAGFKDIASLQVRTDTSWAGVLARAASDLGRLHHADTLPACEASVRCT
jgi:hypothetical protein